MHEKNTTVIHILPFMPRAYALQNPALTAARLRYKIKETGSR